jgi:ADP-heptose:LPS heptosyltransferase/GT2 family glycosyltransferase
MRNVLVTQGNLGDVVCTMPTAEQIKRNRPDLDLIVNCPEEYAGLFEKNPFVGGINLPIRRDDQIYGMRWPLTREERAVPFVDWFAALAGLGHLESRLPTLYKLEEEEVDWPFSGDDIVLAVGTPTRWPTRNWPVERYNEVLSALKKDYGVRVVAVGKSEELAEQAGTLLDGVDLSFIDRLTIRQTAAVLARCNLFLGNDSGLAHLAASCRTTAFTLFGPVHPRTHAHPGWTVPLQHSAGCHGCLTDGRAITFPVERHCPQGLECLMGIETRQVLERIVPFIMDLKSRGGSPKSEEPAQARPIAPTPRTSSKSAPALDFSVLVCCYRFLQRFRVFLYGLSQQTLDRERFEVVVVNPQSPDGLSEYLAQYNAGGQMQVPDRGRLAPEVVEVKVSEAFRRNRGYMIQRAFEASRGRVVMAADGDLVLPPHFMGKALDAIQRNHNAVIGVYRNFLTPQTTAQILSGLLNPIQNFDLLRREDCREKDGYRGVLGYCQIVTREAFERVGYPEEFNRINQSDIEFVKRLEGIGVHPHRLEGETVLHLYHERNWEGVERFM